MFRYTEDMLIKDLSPSAFIASLEGLPFQNKTEKSYFNFLMSKKHLHVTSDPTAQGSCIHSLWQLYAMVYVPELVTVEHVETFVSSMYGVREGNLLFDVARSLPKKFKKLPLKIKLLFLSHAGFRSTSEDLKKREEYIGLLRSVRRGWGNTYRRWLVRWPDVGMWMTKNRPGIMTGEEVSSYTRESYWSLELSGSQDNYEEYKEAFLFWLPHFPRNIMGIRDEVVRSEPLMRCILRGDISVLTDDETNRAISHYPLSFLLKLLPLVPKERWEWKARMLMNSDSDYLLSEEEDKLKVRREGSYFVPIAEVLKALTPFYTPEQIQEFEENYNIINTWKRARVTRPELEWKTR